MPAVKRFELCAGCRKDKDGLVQLKKLFEDTITTSSDLIAYLGYNRLSADVIQQFFALPASNKDVVQYIYKDGLRQLICLECYEGPDWDDYLYTHAFEAILNVGELDSQTFKTISMDLCREAKATLEDFLSNEWYVCFPLAQILHDSDLFVEFASSPEYQELDRKMLRNALSPLLKFEGHWSDENECFSGAAGVAIFDNVKSALAILDKPTRKATRSKSPSLNVKQKPEPKVADAFTVLASSKSVDNRTSAAQDKDIPLKWLKLLSKDKSETVRNAIAGNPQATPAILKVLARDRSEYVVSAVASNTRTAAVTLNALASAQSESIRSSVAGNEKVPVQILQLLAKDKSIDVRTAVARHERTPPRLLVALARDKDEYVRQGVAENPKAPVELLEALSREQGEEGSICRSQVASNPSTPLRILRRLWGDSDEFVRRMVAQNISISKGFLLEILEQSQNLKRNRTTFVSAIAGNRKTPADVLVVLSQDKDKLIRAAVAGNPRTPVVVLIALSQDKDKWVRRVVAENTNTPLDTLRVLARERLPRSEYSGTDVRAAVAGNPSCPVDLLESLAKDKSWWIRVGVAGNPSTNAETLMLLAQDNEGIVRANVSAHDSATPEIKALVYSFKIPISD